MDHIGIDVHKKESLICRLAEGDELIAQRSRTEPERFAAMLGERPRARIVIEASTDSEWVARCLEALGHAGDAGMRVAIVRPVAHPDPDCCLGYPTAGDDSGCALPGERGRILI